MLDARQRKERMVARQFSDYVPPRDRSSSNLQMASYGTDAFGRP